MLEGRELVPDIVHSTVEQTATNQAGSVMCKSPSFLFFAASTKSLYNSSREADVASFLYPLLPPCLSRPCQTIKHTGAVGFFHPLYNLFPPIPRKKQQFKRAS